MEVIITIGVVVILIVLLVVVAGSRFSRRAGDEVEETALAVAPGADVEREFERPPAQDEPPR